MVIARKLVMHTRVAYHLFGDALYVVEALGGIHVAIELGVEVGGMVCWPQRKVEIIHSEDVFQQLAVVIVANAAGGAGIVERVGGLVRAGVEVVIVP